MSKTIYSLLLIILCSLIVPATVNAQSSSVPDGFIERDLFFKPAAVSPSHIGMFEDIAAGFFDHQLQEALLNPSRLGRDIQTQNYLFVNYRTLPTIERRVYRFHSQEDTGEYYPERGPFLIPINTVQTKTEEPRLAAAWIHRPSSLETLVVGIMYRQLQISEPYYDQFMRPLRGGFWHTSAAGEVSQVREQRGTFRQSGHFPSVMASLQMNEALTTGLRLSMSYFTGTGNLQDGRFIDGENAHIDRNVEQRYLQWEAAAGIDLKLTDIRNLGISAGVLHGNAEQLFGVNHFFSRKHGDRYDDDNWNHFRENLSVSQLWNRDGFHYYGTIEMRQLFGENNNNRFRVFYHLGRTWFKIRDRGSSTSHYFNEYTPFNASESFHINRSETLYMDGSLVNGTHGVWEHLIGVTGRYQIGANTGLLIGMQMNRRMKTVETQTGINNLSYHDSERWREGEFITDFSNEYRLSTGFEKNKNRIISANIPVVFRYSFSERISIEGGFLLQYQDLRVSRQVEYIWEYYKYERPDETGQHPPSTGGWSISDGKDRAFAAGLIGIGYSVLPDVIIRFSGVTESSSLNEVPVTGTAQFLLGLEAMF